MARQQIILKLAERCNIDCSYCYYFRGGDRSYLSKPSTVLNDTINGLMTYLDRVFLSVAPKTVQLIFHGGEPLLIGRRRFDEICSDLRRKYSASKLEFCLQTNATMVSEEWIALFEKHNISVCTSVDGPAHIHDQNRLDHRGQGTYHSVVRGVRLLLEAQKSRRLTSVACLSVIQPAFSGREVYTHLVGELGFRQLDFLFPDVTHSEFTGNAKSYGRFLIEAFDEWVKHDDPTVSIRVLQSIISVLMGGRSYLAGFGSGQPDAFTLRSDGSVELDDFLRVCGLGQVTTGTHISNLDATGVVNFPVYQNAHSQFAKLPVDCGNCIISNSCRGGQITHRYREGSGFSNASVFCEGLFSVFTHIAAFLLRNGITLDNIPGLDLPNRVVSNRKLHLAPKHIADLSLVTLNQPE